MTLPNDPKTMHAKRCGPNRSKTDFGANLITMFKGWLFLDHPGSSPGSEGFERIIQVLGCDDGTGLGHDKNLVSVVVARLGAVVSIAYI